MHEDTRFRTAAQPEGSRAPQLSPGPRGGPFLGVPMNIPPPRRGPPPPIRRPQPSQPDTGTKELSSGRGDRIASVSDRAPPVSGSVWLSERMLSRILQIVPEADKEHPRHFANGWTEKPEEGTVDAILWRLARLFKKSPETRDQPSASFRRVIDVAAEMMKVDPERTFDLFADKFARARSDTEGRLDVAKMNAEAAPPALCACYANPKKKLLLGICYYLSQHSMFYLACRAAADLVDTDHETAALWLRSFVRDDFLVKVGEADNYKRRAQEYAWNHAAHPRSAH